MGRGPPEERDWGGESRALRPAGLECALFISHMYCFTNANAYWVAICDRRCPNCYPSVNSPNKNTSSLWTHSAAPTSVSKGETGEHSAPSPTSVTHPDLGEASAAPAGQRHDPGAGEA